jgi:hypothetical protein
VSDETFTERFNRLTEHMSEPELCYVLDLTSSALRKLRDGRTQSLKFDAGLRLAEKLGVSPWYIAGKAEPQPQREIEEAIEAARIKPRAGASLETETEPLARQVGTEAATGMDALASEVREIRTRLEALERERVTARRRAS